MAIEVRIPTILRTYTDGEKAVEGSGATLDELLADLDSRHTGHPRPRRRRRRAAPLRQRLPQRRGRPLPRRHRHRAHRRRQRHHPPGRRRRLPTPDALRQPARRGRQHPAGPPAAPVAVRRGVTLWAKLEDRNPTGSIKDRPALHMIEQAETRRPAHPRLHHPGAHLAATPASRSPWPPGSRATASSASCRRTPPRERRELLAMWGAEIIPSPAAGGSNTAVRVAKELAGRAPGLGDALPVRQPGQRRRALRHHRPGDPRRPAHHHPLRRRASAPPAP